MVAVKAKADSGAAPNAAPENQHTGAPAQSGGNPVATSLKGLGSLNTSKNLSRKYSFAVAAAIFFAVSAMWGWSGIGKLKSNDFGVITWTSSAIRELDKKSTGRPQIDFVGSSLMLVPLGGVDADYHHQKMDLPHHHHSDYVEKLLKKSTGKSLNTFVFALPGEMPSDASLITKFLLNGKKKPDVLVYGVGPRDFLDNTLTSPAATDPYSVLSRFGDISDRVDVFAADWQERLNFYLGRMIYPYGKKEDLCTSFNRAVVAFDNRFLPGKPITLNERRVLLPDYHRLEVGVNDCTWEPSTPETRAFKDNVYEYRARYKTLKWETYLAQMQSFGDLLETCNKRHIKVIVMSMPITDINRKLMPSFTWDIYSRGVRVLAKSKGASYIDVEGMNKFVTSDFMDTVHLHSLGGKKLLDILCAKMVQDPAVLSALHISKQDLLSAAAANSASAKTSSSSSSKIAKAKGGVQL